MPYNPDNPRLKPLKKKDLAALRKDLEVLAIECRAIHDALDQVAGQEIMVDGALGVVRALKILRGFFGQVQGRIREETSSNYTP